MKIMLKVLSLVSAALLLFACDNVGASKKSAETKAEAAPAASAAPEAIVEVVEVIAVENADPVKEKLGAIRLDGSSQEAAAESLREMRMAIRELPEADQLAARGALARLSIEAGAGGRGANNRQNFRDMSQDERRAATEAMRERAAAANLAIAKKYAGKNVYEIMAAVQAMPALSAEQQQTLENMMRAPQRQGQGGQGQGQGQRQRRNNNNN